MLQCYGMRYEQLSMTAKSPDSSYLRVLMLLINLKYIIPGLAVLPDCVCCLWVCGSRKSLRAKSRWKNFLIILTMTLTVRCQNWLLKTLYLLHPEADGRLLYQLALPKLNYLWQRTMFKRFALRMFQALMARKEMRNWPVWYFGHTLEMYQHWLRKNLFWLMWLHLGKWAVT